MRRNEWLAKELARLWKADHEAGEMGSEQWDDLAGFVVENHRPMELALKYHDVLVEALQGLLYASDWPGPAATIYARALLKQIEKEAGR